MRVLTCSAIGTWLFRQIGCIRMRIWTCIRIRMRMRACEWRASAAIFSHRPLVSGPNLESAFFSFESSASLHVFGPEAGVAALGAAALLGVETGAAPFLPVDAGIAAALGLAAGGAVLAFFAGSAAGGAPLFPPALGCIITSSSSSSSSSSPSSSSSSSSPLPGPALADAKMRACCRTHAAHDSTTTSSTVTNTSGRSSQCRRVSSPMLSPRHARYNPSD
mmetsp:Transcript_41856/g.115394  ORF Transcript_41856/g.115394 Transcript_41856/m.115394 type:complete len:220 (+) Transcript_41856:589-1248(+)